MLCEVIVIHSGPNVNNCRDRPIYLKHVQWIIVLSIMR